MKTHEALKIKRPLLALVIAGLLAVPTAVDYIAGDHFDLIDQVSAANPDAGRGKGAGGVGKGAGGAGLRWRGR